LGKARRSLRFLGVFAGKPEAFRKECGKAAKNYFEYLYAAWDTLSE
jgi:hypothetical protein